MWVSSVSCPLIGLLLIVVIKKHPDGGRVGIVMLSGFVSPEECAKENQGDEYTAADEEEDNAHDIFLINRCFEA